MKRVLIIAHLSDAAPRIPSLTRFFKDFGWEATIVSPHLDAALQRRIGADELYAHGVHVVYTDYPGDKLEWARKILMKRGMQKTASFTEQIKEKLEIRTKRSWVNKLMLLYQEFFCFPDSESTWIEPAKKELSKMLKTTHFDAVISTSPYPTSHVIAHWVTTTYGIPWIAEFRDPWSDNHHSPYGFLRKKIDLKLEKKLMKKAAHIVVALPKLVASYARKHRKTVTLIHNGYMPDSVATHHVLPATLTLNYTGAIYEQKHDVELLVKALKKVVNKKKLRPQIQVNFVGKPVGWVEQLVKENDLANIVHFSGVVSHREALLRQANSHALLIFGWNDVHDTGNYPTKFFEYMAARRPIFIVGGPANEEIKLMVQKAHAGYTATTIDETVKVLKDMITTFEETKNLPTTADTSFFDRFNCKHLAQDYCHVLDSLNKHTP